jgi:hypothetical protein
LRRRPVIIAPEPRKRTSEATAAESGSKQNIKAAADQDRARNATRRREQRLIYSADRLDADHVSHAGINIFIVMIGSSSSPFTGVACADRGEKYV